MLVEGFESRVKVFYVVVPVSGAIDLTKDKGPRRPEKTSISVLGSYSKAASSVRDGPCKELLSLHIASAGRKHGSLLCIQRGALCQEWDQNGQTIRLGVQGSRGLGV